MAFHGNYDRVILFETGWHFMGIMKGYYCLRLNGISYKLS